MFMGKKRKAVMLGVNVFLVLALLWSVVFTVDRKNAAYTNTDIERYKSLYGYLVTTSPQSSVPPSAAPSLQLGH